MRGRDQLVVVLSSLTLAMWGVWSLAGCTNSDWWDNGPLLVEVRGDDYEWHITYAGPDRALNTSDDIVDMRDVHVPVATPVQIQLRSEDYVYLLALPDLELKQVAVPDMEFNIDFQFDVAGAYELEGNQLCGFRHETLMGKVFVQSREQFRAWLQDRHNKAG